MSILIERTTSLLEMLPEQDQSLAYEVIKRLVLAWDSDFTKLTLSERKLLEQAESEITKGETVSHDDIDWS